MTDVNAIKEAVKTVLASDATVASATAFFEVGYSEPPHNNGHISILSGAMSTEGMREFVPITVAIRTRVPKRVNSDVVNDMLHEAVVNALTSQANKRLSGLVSNLVRWESEAYSENEELEVRSKALTFVYEIVYSR